jgi:hypothetical protein
VGEYEEPYEELDDETELQLVEFYATQPTPPKESRNDQRRRLYIAMAEACAKKNGLRLVYDRSGPWVEMFGQITGMDQHAYVKERGWKAASDAFCKEATAWYHKEMMNKEGYRASMYRTERAEE